MRYRFQLVFQVDAQTIEDFDQFIDLEEAIRTHLATTRETMVDGHDFGMGEFNIFILTNEPESVFKKVADFIGDRDSDLPFSAAYRGLDDETYVPLWPASLTSFSVA